MAKIIVPQGRRDLIFSSQVEHVVLLCAENMKWRDLYLIKLIKHLLQRHLQEFMCCWTVERLLFHLLKLLIRLIRLKKLLVWVCRKLLLWDFRTQLLHLPLKVTLDLDQSSYNGILFNCRFLLLQGQLSIQAQLWGRRGHFTYLLAHELCCHLSLNIQLLLVEVGQVNVIVLKKFHTWVDSVDCTVCIRYPTLRHSINLTRHLAWVIQLPFRMMNWRLVD